MTVVIARRFLPKQSRNLPNNRMCNFDLPSDLKDYFAAEFTLSEANVRLAMTH
jgi:hypothetical protein